MPQYKKNDGDIKKTYVFFDLNENSFLYQNLYGSVKKNFKNVKFRDYKDYESNTSLDAHNKLFDFFENHQDSNVIIMPCGFYWDIQKKRLVSELLYNSAKKNNITLFIYMWDSDHQFSLYERYWAYFIAGYALEDEYYIKKYSHYDNPLVNPYWLSFGCNFNLFKYKRLPKKYDVLFIGQPRSGRGELMSYLADKGVSIKVFGNGWDKYKNLEPYCGGFLDQKSLIDVLNQTKIVLTICTAFKQNEWKIKGRLFEWLGCKIFQITNHDPRLKEFFEIGKEIITYKDEKDLVEKINYYLEHDDEREEIAENAYKSAKERYDNDKLIKGFSDFINRGNYVQIEKDMKYSCSVIFHNIEKDEFLKIVKKLSQKHDYYYLDKSGKFHSYDLYNSKFISDQNVQDLKDYIILISGNIVVSPKNLNVFIDAQVFNAENNLPKVSFCNYYVSDKEIIIGSNLFGNLTDKKMIVGANLFITNLNFEFFKKDEFLSDYEKIKDRCVNKKFIYKVSDNFVETDFPLIRIKDINTYFGNGITGKISKYYFLRMRYRDDKSYKLFYDTLFLKTARNLVLVERENKTVLIIFLFKTIKDIFLGKIGISRTDTIKYLFLGITEKLIQKLRANGKM